jgi:hypothetical protein
VLLAPAVLLLAAIAPLGAGAAAASQGSWSAGVVVPPGSTSELSPAPTAVSCAGSACTAVGSDKVGGGYGTGLAWSESSGSWPASGLPLPAGANAQPATTIGSISCIASSCAATGTYDDSYDNSEGLLLAGSSGSWSATEAPLPGGVGPSGSNGVSGIDLGEVSCAAAGSCASFGSYLSGGHYHEFMLNDSSGAWRAVAMPQPAHWSGITYSVGGVSCGAAGSCLAVGDYEDTSYRDQGMLLSDSSGTWTASELSGLPGSPSSPNVTLSAVSCTSSTSCLAVGDYDDTSGNQQALLVSGAPTSPSASSVAAPASAGSNPDVSLNAVSCTTADCVAAGSFLDSSGNTQALIVSNLSGSWAATSVAPPNAASNPDAKLTAVSCDPTVGCAATGTYQDASGDTQSMLVTYGSNGWAATEAPVPTGFTSPQVQIVSVSCASSGCAAAGTFDANGYTQGLLLGGSPASPASWSASEAPLGSGQAPNDAASVQAVGCDPASSCVALGRYVDSSGNDDLLILTDSGGAWTASQGPLPSGASGLDWISQVVCPAPGDCVAVGDYDEQGGGQDGLLLTETNGTWSASQAPLPSAGSDAYLSSVSCPSATSCVAVGSYWASSDWSQYGMILAGSFGSSWSWSAAVAPEPGNAAGDDEYLETVSCTSTSSCLAAGQYDASTDNYEGALLTGSTGTSGWSAVEAALPSGASTSDLQNVGFDSIACASATSCTALGGYLDSSGQDQAMFVQESSGAWQAAAKVVLPAGAATTGQTVSMWSAACASSASCTAVGSYYDSSGHRQAMIAAEISGAWQQAGEVTLPAGASSNPDASLTSISCSALGCAAGGTYVDSSGYNEGLLLNGSGSSFTASEAPLPAGVATNPGADPDEVACASSGACVAAGDVLEPNGGVDSLVESYAPPPEVSAPASVGWSVTLNGYDQSVASPVGLTVSDSAPSGWDLTVQASGLPTSAGATLASPVINGSGTSAASSAAPAQGCVGNCTAPSGDSVSYPLAIPTAAAADLYNAAAGSGIGQVTLATDWWAAVPANSAASSGGYTATVTLTVSSGP